MTTTPARTLLPVTLLTAAGFALTVVAFYPGHMTNDAGYVYEFAGASRLGDWQSPLMSMLWRVIDPVAPGSGSMFLLIAALYWLGFGLIACTIARRSAVLGLLVPIIALTPPAFMLLSMIWRDILFGPVWLLAAALAYAGTDRTLAIRRPLQALALALVAFGVLLRPNAIFAAPIIAAYVLWPLRLEWKRAAILFVPGVAVALGLIQLVYYGVLDVKREHPAHSLMVFDLGGITHFSGENQFPVTWSAEETALLTGRCYDADRWDAYWTMEPCRFVMQRLERPDDVVFGTPRLTASWRRAVLAHPLAYLRHRASASWQFFAGRTLTLELYHARDPARMPLAGRATFRAAVALHDWLKAWTPLFRTGFWLLLAAGAVAMAWRARATPSGAFAIGTTGSGIVYVLTYIPIGVAADFRYGYWLILATLAGGAAAFAARRESNAAVPAPAARATS